MTEPDEQDEATEPSVADVPEPDQDAHEPTEEEADADAEHERLAEPDEQRRARTTPEEWEKRHAKAKKAFKSYTASVGRIYEEDANAYLPCPLCSDEPSGFLNPADFGKYPEEIVQVVLGVLGSTSASEVPDDPYSNVCATCGGWGVVRTGSKVPNQETRTCLDCTGRGYIPRARSRWTWAQTASRATARAGDIVPPRQARSRPEVRRCGCAGYTIVPPMQAAS